MTRSMLPFGLKSSALAAILAAIASPVAGQTLQDIEFEGPISAVTANSITVMGVEIAVPDGTFSTPTGKGFLLPDMNNALPGRPTGFIGGTAIVAGASTGGIVTADAVTSDVSENVIVGEITEVTPRADGTVTVRLNGTLVTPLDDPRLEAVAQTELGFPIVVASIQLNTLAAVEGYWVEKHQIVENGQTVDRDPMIYYHHLAADSATLTNAAKDEVTIVRARCLGDGTRMEIRGGAHPPQTLPLPVAEGLVRVSVIAGTTSVEVLGTEFVEPDAAGMGRWRMRILDNPQLAEDDGLGGTRCRKNMRLKAELLALGGGPVLAETEEDVEVR